MESSVRPAARRSRVTDKSSLGLTTAQTLVRDANGQGGRAAHDRWPEGRCLDLSDAMTRNYGTLLALPIAFGGACVAMAIAG